MKISSKDNKKIDTIKDLRDINRALGFVPFLPLFCFLMIGVYGIWIFEQIPEYGRNPDPSSLKITWLQGLAILPLMLSIISIPASILLTIHLILNNARFRRSDKISLALLLGSLAAFFLLKYGAPDFFLWIMD